MLDFYRVASLFTPEELQARAAARAFLEAEAAPHIADWWEQGVFPRHLVPQLGELGMIGANMPMEHGGGGASNTAHGLIMYELERIDSGLRSFASVQTGLIMYPILTYGSDSQVRQYLPGVARGELAGCFALTEHDGGSDPASMRTTARRDGGGDYVIDGAKMWISYGNIADFVLVWARGETGIMGFIVPAGTPGLTANPVKRKMSLRASDTSELVFDGVRVPASHRLPGAEGPLRAPLVPDTGAVRHRLGRTRRAGGGLLGGPGVRGQPRHLRKAHSRPPARPGQAGEDGKRPHPGPADGVAAGPPQGRKRPGLLPGLAGQARQRTRRPGGRQGRQGTSWGDPELPWTTRRYATC